MGLHDRGRMDQVWVYRTNYANIPDWLYTASDRWMANVIFVLFFFYFPNNNLFRGRLLCFRIHSEIDLEINVYAANRGVQKSGTTLKIWDSKSKDYLIL